MESPEESGEFNAEKLLNFSEYQNKRLGAGKPEPLAKAPTNDKS